MVSKSRIKYIKSLAKKKFRDSHQQFVVEGYKSILELIDSGCVADQVIVEEQQELRGVSYDLVSKKTMKQLSNLHSPPGYMAVFNIPKSKPINDTKQILALDDVSDPGNLGTIIRLCDWFGIKDLVCSIQTVDCYNPKVIQASMGSLARVNIIYTDLEEFVKNSKAKVYTTQMKGRNVYEKPLEHNAILIMGNESHGVRESLLQNSEMIAIPRYGKDQQTESLNVASATSILLGEWCRTIEM